MKYKILSFGLLALMAGCKTVGPDYEQQEAKAIDVSSALQKKGDEIDFKALKNWWESFNDQDLNKLIITASTDNYDLKTAKSKIAQARAILGITEADLLPTVDAGASFGKSRTSDNAGGNGANDLYRAGFDAGWEIDVFGGTKRAIEAAKADLLAREIGLQDVLVMLNSEIARNYIGLRGYQLQLQVAKNNLKTQTETFKIIKSKYDSGLSDGLALNQAKYNLAQTRSALPVLYISIEETINSLAILTGQTPGSLQKSLGKTKPIPMPAVDSIIGIPAEAIRKRPDIRVAEQQLIAETARIGEVTADLYPKFRLAGSIGLESIEASDFLESGSKFYSFGPSITWNLFDAGAIRNRIKAQTEVKQQFVYNYEQIVLMAIKEVRDSLTAYAQEKLRYDALTEAVESAKSAESIAKDQYSNGLSDFNNVLDAQRSLLEFEAKLAESKGLISANMIKVYKSLGGSWSSLATTEKEK